MTAGLPDRAADRERDEDGLTVTEQLMARVIWDEFHNQWHGDAPDIEPRTIAQAITAALAARPAPDDGETA